MAWDYNNLSRNQLKAWYGGWVSRDYDLIFFAQFWYKVIHNTDFLVNWHHREIANELRKVQLFQTEHLNINMPPRMSKTELAAVMFIAASIAINPKGNNLYISASDELRSQTSVEIRNIVSHPYFYTLFGVKMRKDQNAKNLWRTDQGGGLKTATIFGQITGFGAGRMVDASKLGANRELINLIQDFDGSIILDDVNKTDDSAVENATNDKVVRVITNTVLSRKNRKETPVIHIQQRAGMSDATAFFLDYYKVGLPDQTLKTKFMVFPAVSDDGVLLWENKLGWDQVKLLRDNHETSGVWDCQYQQNPNNKEGLVFPMEELNRIERKEITGIIARHGYIDPKDDGKDYLSAPFGDLLPNGKIFIRDFYLSQDFSEITLAELSLLVNELKPISSRIETNGLGSMFRKQFSTLINSPLYPCISKGNKHQRILSMSPFVRKHFVFRTDYEPGSHYDIAMKFLTTYRKDGSSKVDDVPDSVVGLAYFFYGLYPGSWPDILPEIMKQ